MARPRVFVSSTFYDLRQYRKDIESFIKEMGYEPVLNERGHIPYGKDEKLEEYCYQEINGVDILVSIIGGRFGSASRDENYSISNIELKVARELNKQVYIFIDRSVDVEYQTYLNNKENKNVKYKYVDETRIYSFIEELKGLATNNVLFQFESADDIITFLREQWAGLFQRLLSESSRIRESSRIESIMKTAETLNGLVELFSRSSENKDTEIKELLFKNHPAYSQLKEMLGLEFPIVFNNFTELRSLLRYLDFNLSRHVLIHLKGRPAPEPVKTFLFRSITKDGESKSLTFSKKLFDPENNLVLYTNSTWSKDLIELEMRNLTSSST